MRKNYINNQTKSMNLEGAYNDLKSAISKRSGYQEHYNNLWSNVHKGYNRQSELLATSKNIGECTHKINEIIGNLCKCRRQHKAMNMAHGYLLEEINRTKTIISSWQRKIDVVEKGKKCWINSDGTRDFDSTSPKSYLAKKQRYLAKLINWDSSVSRCLVRC